jgi:hypothetical protein
MKSTMMSVVALLCAGAVTACSGVSTIGSGDEPTPGGSRNTMGGAEVLPGTGGGSKGGKSSGMGGAATAGRDPGMGGSAQVECATDMDCAIDLTCQLCPDRSEICSKAVCLPGGKCARQQPICSSIVMCSTVMDCPVLDVDCIDCGDGSEACPTVDCSMGVCQNSFSGCTSLPGVCDELPCGAPCDSEKKLFCNERQQCQAEPPMSCGLECKTVMDCGLTDASCVPCPDGSCKKTDCIAGTCQQICESSGKECRVFEDCDGVGDICIPCPGGNNCAVEACVQNTCQMVCPVE